MQWKFSGEKPVYQQIMELLRSAILAGEYGPGSRVEPVRELALAANVNPNTMQRAMVELEREGLLVGCGTIGRFVTDDPKILQHMRDMATESIVRSCAEKFRALGLTMEQAAEMLLALDKEE